MEVEKVEYQGRIAQKVDLAHSIIHYSKQYFCQCKKPARYLILQKGNRKSFCLPCWKAEELQQDDW
ncbi:hypothetical protein [Paraferrimonas sp. SM1919]|uniref:hypothetical protein n=1 Tax=Paraferrimonas sp. SM1919 TaxID=2662263 RepID=UPI0013D5AC6F|nr:hypothetical protein [Paraferrimonas sp. SM1919]